MGVTRGRWGTKTCMRDDSESERELGDNSLGSANREVKSPPMRPTQYRYQFSYLWQMVEQVGLVGGRGHALALGLIV